MAQVRPVADIAVTHAHDVGQPVAIHVRQKNTLFAVGEHDCRAGFFIERFGRLASRAESVAALRFVPGEDLIFGDQQVGLAVAGQVDHARVGIADVDVGHLFECLKARHVWIEFEKTFRRIGHVHQLLGAVGVEVGQRQLLTQSAERRFRRDLVRVREGAIAHAALVIPAVSLLRQDARQAFAV